VSRVSFYLSHTSCPSFDRTKEEQTIRKLDETTTHETNTAVLSLLSYQRKLLVFPHGDKSTDDARGDEEQRKPEQGETDAVLWWDVIHRKQGHDNRVSSTKTIHRDRDDGKAACDRKHKDKGDVRDVDLKQEKCDEVQLRVKDNPTEKREKEGKQQASEAGEVFIEGFHGVLHVLLYDLE